MSTKRKFLGFVLVVFATAILNENIKLVSIVKPDTETDQTVRTPDYSV